MKKNNENNNRTVSYCFVYFSTNGFHLFFVRVVFFCRNIFLAFVSLRRSYMCVGNYVSLSRQWHLHTFFKFHSMLIWFLLCVSIYDQQGCHFENCDEKILERVFFQIYIQLSVRYLYWLIIEIFIFFLWIFKLYVLLLPMPIIWARFLLIIEVKWWVSWSLDGRDFLLFINLKVFDSLRVIFLFITKFVEKE